MTWFAIASAVPFATTAVLTGFGFGAVFIWTIMTLTYGLSGKGYDWECVGMGAIFTGICASLTLMFGLIAYFAGAFN